MHKLIKKVVALGIALTLTLGGASSTMAAQTLSGTPVTAWKTGDELKGDDTNVHVIVSSKKNKTLTLTKSSAKKSDKAVTVKSTRKMNGTKYTVTAVGANAVKGYKVQTLTLSKTVTKVLSGAFTGAKSLKTVKVATTKKVTVNKNAFKGLTKKQMKNVVVKVNKKMSKANYNALVKQLVKAGVSQKNIKKVKM